MKISFSKMKIDPHWAVGCRASLLNSYIGSGIPMDILPIPDLYEGILKISNYLLTLFR